MEDSSFEAFYQAEYRAVLAIALALTGERAKAEDVIHDSFTAAFEQWDKLTNPEGWIRRVVTNKARSSWRRSAAEDRAGNAYGSAFVATPDGRLVVFGEADGPRREAPSGRAMLGVYDPR